MKTITERLRERLLSGVDNVRLPSYAELAKTEWSPSFERLMRNRLIMGALRYGKLNAPGKKRYDRMEYIARKSEEYKKTGNTECLVDIANLALCEYVEGNHPQKHFAAKDDHTTHCQEV